MQDNTLSEMVSSVDIATKENLEDLVKVGEGLLKKPVSRMNLQTDNFEPSNHETNAEALIRYTMIFLPLKRSNACLVISVIKFF